MAVQRDPDGAPGKQLPAYPIASVDKALLLLLMFRDHRRLRLSDVRASLNVASSTAHRLLAMLTYHDFVRQEPGLRTYVAGPALVDIGFAAVRKMDIRSHAKPVLERLADQLAETVHLVELEGSNVRYLDAVESPRALRVAARTGSILPAHCTAAGKVLLAALGDGRLGELYPPGEPLPTLSPRSLTTLEDLRAEVLRVRAAGHASDIGESDEGVVSLAVGVRDDRDLVVAALGASAPASRMPRGRRSEVVAELSRAAEEIHRAVSGRS